MFAKKYVPIAKIVHTWLFVHSLPKCMFWNWFSKNYVQITMSILFWLLGHTFWQTYFWKGLVIVQVPSKSIHCLCFDSKALIPKIGPQIEYSVSLRHLISFPKQIIPM